MTESSHDVQDLGARLAEIDRRLAEIQDELRPGGAPPPPRPPEPPPRPREPPPRPPEPPHKPEPPPQPSPRTGPLADVLQRIPRQPRLAGDALLRRIEQLTEVQAELVSSLHELLAGFDDALVHLSGELVLAARPFSEPEAVRAFERALVTLPGVESVALRGYEGADGALIEVRLARPTPYSSGR